MRAALSRRAARSASRTPCRGPGRPCPSRGTARRSAARRSVSLADLALVLRDEVRTLPRRSIDLASLLGLAACSSGPGKRSAQKLRLSTFTSSHGGLPRMQSKPGRSRRNTSGKATGKWSAGARPATVPAREPECRPRDALVLVEVCDGAVSPRRAGDEQVEQRRAGSTASAASSCARRGLASRRPIVASVTVAEPRQSDSVARSSQRVELAPEQDIGRSGRSGPGSRSASSIVPMPVRLLPTTRLWSRKRQRQAGHERVDPEREPGQLDGDRVEVHAVDAAAGDLPAQQASCPRCRRPSAWSGPRASTRRVAELVEFAVDDPASGARRGSATSRASIRSTAATRK